MIRVGFSTRRRNPISCLIRWLTGSRFSHTWFVYHHPLYRCDVVVEADAHGIIELSYARFKQLNDDVVELCPPATVDLTGAMVAMGPALGTPYDYGSLLGRLWVHLWRWLGRKVRNPLRDTQEDCCVENVYRLLQAGGLLREVDPEEESPQSLHDRLVALGWKGT